MPEEGLARGSGKVEITEGLKREDPPGKMKRVTMMRRRSRMKR